LKRILITGANRGVGLELARQYTLQGDRVFAGCRSSEKVEALETLSTQYPSQVTILPIDVTDVESLERSVVQVRESVDALDLLFNNAAINLGDEHLSEVTAEVLLQTLHVNAVGAVLVAQKFVDLLQAGETPKLINVSSEAGSIARMKHFRGYGYYGSKAAMNMYTRSLAFDPQTNGIIVISLHPGWVRTDMGGPEAHLSTGESVAGIMSVTKRLTPADNGKFFTWEGVEYPW
jgi:NAD(P)-dependent dehydrogenase (short-subunit alcohol dehydrogenase family)